MAWFQKPATGTAVRNPWCPMENDKLGIGIAVDEGSGTSLANLGKSVDAPFASSFTCTGTPTWGTESGIGPKLTFDGSTQVLPIMTASGADVTLRRLVFKLFFRPTSTTGNRTWIGMTQTSGTNGQLRAWHSPSTDTLTVAHLGGSTITFPLAEGTLCQLFVDAGEKGFGARLFTASGEVAGTYTIGSRASDTGPVVLKDGDTWAIAGLGATGGRAAGDLLDFCYWYWQLEDRMIEQLAADPSIWSRPILDDLSPLNNPMVGRATDASAYIGGFVASESLSGTCYLRVVASATLNGMISSPDVLFSVNTATLGATLGSIVNDLGGARFWIASVSSDGTTYYPTAGGMGKFRTKREPGEAYEAAVCSDSRFNIDLQGGVHSPGYFTDSSWPNNKFAYMIWDIFHTEPDWVLFGGNEWGNTAATSLSDFDAWVKWRNYVNPITQTCCCFAALGRHDREVGWRSHLSSSGTLGNQADAQALRAKFWVNPNDETYDAGGSATGNYYGFDWGDLLALVVDPTTYSNVGEALANSVSPPYVFGSTQKTWAETAADAATQAHKMFYFPQSPGGIRNSAGAERWFGRGSMAQVGKGRLSASGIVFTSYERSALGSLSPGLGIPEEDWMHDFLRANRFNVGLRGLDNQFIWVRKQTVNYITVPTGQALFQYGDNADGKDFKGDFNIGFSDRFADGVQAGRTGYGYIRLFVDSTGVSYVYRRTFIGIRAGADTKDEIGPHIRDVGPLMTGTDGAITLPETPRMVHCVVAAADGVWTASTQANIENDFATYNRYTEPHTSAGASDFDEPYANGNITYSTTGLAAGSQSIYVEYAPRSIGLNGTTTPIPLYKASKSKPRRAMMGVGR